MSDVEFCEQVERFLGRLRQAGRMAGHRITRRKLGLGPAELGGGQLSIEVEDLAQLEPALLAVAQPLSSCAT